MFRSQQFSTDLPPDESERFLLDQLRKVSLKRVKGTRSKGRDQRDEIKWTSLKSRDLVIQAVTDDIVR